MKNSITVYGKPNCVQCNATQKYLDRAKINYVKVDVTENEAAYKHVTEGLGYQQVPVVESGSTHWSGFQPDQLAKLVAI